LGIITLESTNTFSATQTGRFLYSLVVLIFGRVDPSTFAIFHAVLRKVGHLFGYGILSFLLFRAWRATLRSSNSTNWALRWSAVAFCMSTLVASLDEWHQMHLASRTGTLSDILLDSAAALAVQLLLFAWLWNREVGARRYTPKVAGE
jgi:VanZ family protein